jgi:hypothetical protein
MASIPDPVQLPASIPVRSASTIRSRPARSRRTRGSLEARRRADQARDGLGLPGADLQREQPAGRRCAARRRDDLADHVEPVAAREERGAGLPIPHLRLQRRLRPRARCTAGWRRSRRTARRPRARKPRLPGTRRARVAPRARWFSRRHRAPPRDVGRDDRAKAPSVREAQRDRARARADVQRPSAPRARAPSAPAPRPPAPPSPAAGSAPGGPRAAEAPGSGVPSMYCSGSRRARRCSRALNSASSSGAAAARTGGRGRAASGRAPRPAAARRSAARPGSPWSARYSVVQRSSSTMVQVSDGQWRLSGMLNAREIALTPRAPSKLKNSGLAQAARSSCPASRSRSIISRSPSSTCCSACVV